MFELFLAILAGVAIAAISILGLTVLAAIAIVCISGTESVADDLDYDFED